jgi:hypothetical protein
MLSSMEGQSEKSSRMANPRFDWSGIKWKRVKFSSPRFEWHPRPVRAHKLSIVTLAAFVVAAFLKLSYFFFDGEVRRLSEFSTRVVLTTLSRWKLPSPNTTSNGAPSNLLTYPAF